MALPRAWQARRRSEGVSPLPARPPGRARHDAFRGDARPLSEGALAWCARPVGRAGWPACYSQRPLCPQVAASGPSQSSPKSQAVSSPPWEAIPQSACELHRSWRSHRAGQEPPQSTSDSSPSRMWSSHVECAQIRGAAFSCPITSPATQEPLTQSAPVVHARPSGHRAHVRGNPRVQSASMPSRTSQTRDGSRASLTDVLRIRRNRSHLHVPRDVESRVRAIAVSFRLPTPSPRGLRRKKPPDIR